MIAIVKQYREIVITSMEWDTNVFLRFESCPRCGSRDNLSRWSDGHAWCFGCKYYEAANAKARLQQALSQISPKVNSKLGEYPSDASRELGAKGWTWLNKYGILRDELTNFRWSDSKEWLIYEIDGKSAWQARCFGPNEPKKYHTYGNVSDILHIIGTNNKEIILCEDVLSAIKISRFTQAMPIWGSNIPLKTLVRLARLFSRVGIWLDRDKATESLKSNRRASQLGLAARSIITELDPKEYNDEAIQEFLEGLN